MAELRIYGGDPRVIATLDEIARVAWSLRAAAEELEAAVWCFGYNPIPNLQLAFAAPAVADRLRNLANCCDQAANQYFSTEAQIDAWFQCSIGSLQALGQSIGHAPIATSMVSFAATGTLVAALATKGLTALPDSTSTTQVRTATKLAPLLLGARDLPHALSFLPRQESGSAVMVGYGSASPANSMAEHAKRIRELYQTPGQIRIERYQSGSSNQYVVYIPGTQLGTRDSNPLSALSNLHAMAGPNRAPSEKAVRAAISQAGVERSDRVLFVGHSQGAMVAANIASSNPEFKVSGLLSFGGPLAQRDLSGIPVIAFENSGDPVPGLGGKVNPLTSDLVTVINDSVSESFVEAHSIDKYVSSAISADQSTNPGLIRVAAILEIPSSSGTSATFDLLDLEDSQQRPGQKRGD